MMTTMPTLCPTLQPTSGGGGEAPALVPIIANNGMPIPQTEGAPNKITFRVQATTALTGSVTFDYLTVDNSAIGGGAGDYTKIPITSGTIPVNPGYVDIEVDLVAADSVWKPNRSFFFDISNVEGNAGGDPPVITRSRAVGAITDNSPAPTVAVGDGQPDPVAQLPGNTTQTFTISLTGTTTGADVLVDYATSGGTATPGEDYEETSGTATIAAGQSSVDVDVTILGGNTVVGTESYLFTISNARSQMGAGDPEASLTITDATGQGNIKGPDAVSMGDGTPNPQTEANPAGITFRLQSDGTPPLPTDITGTWRTNNGTAIADNPGDFTGVTSAPYTIPLADGFVDVVVALEADDNRWAPDRDFTAEIVTSSAPISDPFGAGNITDSLAKPTISVSDAVPNPAIQNTHTSVTFTITATTVPDMNVLIDYATRDGTATAGEDYTAASGTATILAGQTTATVDVTVLTGLTVTGTETFFLDISNARDTGGSLSFTITDGEGQANLLGLDAISMGDGTPSPQTEANPAGITFRILSSGTPPLPTDITGTWRTVNGTAVAGEPGDFTGVTNAPFTIPLAVGFVDVTVDLEAADAAWAPDRSFTAEIVTADAPISDASGDGTITDSLTKPTISISDGVPNPAVKGTDPTVTFTLTASEAPKYDIQVDVATADDTAQAGTDYTAVNTTVTILAGQTTATVDVTVIP